MFHPLSVCEKYPCQDGTYINHCVFKVKGSFRGYSMLGPLQIYHSCLRLRSLTATSSYKAKKDIEQFWHMRNGERNKTSYKFLIMPAAV
jgi:hypothetical protein